MKSLSKTFIFLFTAGHGRDSRYHQAAVLEVHSNLLHISAKIEQLDLHMPPF